MLFFRRKFCSALFVSLIILTILLLFIAKRHEYITKDTINSYTDPYYERLQDIICNPDEALKLHEEDNAAKTKTLKQSLDEIKKALKNYEDVLIKQEKDDKLKVQQKKESRKLGNDVRPEDNDNSEYFQIHEG